jgi:hypothetical protein
MVPTSQPTSRPSTEPAEEAVLPFFQNWQAKAASATPGTAAALFFASWVVFSAVGCIFMYRRVKYEMTVREIKRKQREAEEAYAKLEEEFTGIIQKEKYEFWRSELKDPIEISIEKDLSPEVIQPKKKVVNSPKILKSTSTSTSTSTQQPNLLDMDHTKRYRPLATVSPSKRQPIIYSSQKDVKVGLLNAIVPQKQLRNTAEIRLSSKSPPFQAPRVVSPIDTTSKVRVFTSQAQMREITTGIRSSAPLDHKK